MTLPSSNLAVVVTRRSRTSSTFSLLELKGSYCVIARPDPPRSTPRSSSLLYTATDPLIPGATSSLARNRATAQEEALWARTKTREIGIVSLDFRFAIASVGALD